MKRYISYCVICLIVNTISFANIYQVPLNVNGYYEFMDFVSFNINLGTQLTEIHDVRFNCTGDIAGIAAPGLFMCAFPTGPAISQDAYTDAISSISFTPFTCDNIPFISCNGATWDFLLDGEASGYTGLIAGIIYTPEHPPEQIYGNIYSASITINATPVPEPYTLLLLAGGSIVLFRKRIHRR